MRTYRVPLVGDVGVFLGHFRINLHQTRTQYSNEEPQHCNSTEPNFRKSLSKSRILSPKKRGICQFPPSKQQTVAAAGSIDSDDVSPRPLTSVDARPRPIAHKSTTNSRTITKIGRRVLNDTPYIAHQFEGHGHKLTSSVRLIFASS